ncbi:peptidoglycan DD-metalloendopeptidase family protein [Arsenicicoccus dermatophilus]|uniref:peptidoglycan DD-metalloendopeptidase family protein n=1 Tax=Arsenicicoccus dermatophilus TaxID=1076331 RepID=UPI0039175942
MPAPTPRTTSRGSSALCCVLALGLPAPAWAQESGTDDQLRGRQAQVQESLEGAQGRLEITTAELAAAYDALVQAQGQLPRAQEQEAAATRAWQEARRTDQELADRLAEATVQEQQAAAELAATRTALATVTGRLGRVAAEMQAGGSGNLDPLSVLVQAQTPDELYTRYQGLEAVGSVQAQDARDLATARAEETAKQARLDAVQDEVARLKKQSEKRVRSTAQAQARAATARTRVEQLVAQAGRATAEIESRRSEEEARVADLDVQARALTAELADRTRRRKEAAAAAAVQRAREAAAAQAAQETPTATRTATPPADTRATTAPRAPRARDSQAVPRPRTVPRVATSPHGGAVLSAPAAGRITSPFGMRFHPVLKYVKLHTGTDFGTGCGAPVHAAADGQIVSAGFNRAYGNRVVLDNGILRGHDLVTTYNHLTSITVYGGRVRRGQLLGYSGTTGYSTGCHLHFETIVDGVFQNPTLWL